MASHKILVLETRVRFLIMLFMDFNSLFKGMSYMFNKENENNKAKEPTEKEPLLVTVKNNPITTRIEINYYATSNSEALPVILYLFKEVSISYKGFEKKVKLSKDPKEYYLDREENFGYIVITLHKNKRIVPFKEVFQDERHKKNWEDQMLDKSIRDMQYNEEDLI